MTDTAEAPTPARGWDPLAADPAGWDLPDAPPTQEPPRPTPPPTTQAPQRRPRSRVGSATFALAVLTAGGGVLAGLNGVDWFSVQHIIGLVLGVVGIGLVTGAFAGGGGGLIGLAIPLSIAGMVLTTASFHDIDFRGGVGDLDRTPQSMAELKPLYQHAAGDIRLDLTKMPAGAPYSTAVSNGAGETTVIVPATADVTFECSTGAGSAACFGRSSDGVDQEAITGTDNGTDGPGGQKITLKVTNSVGSVEVRRG